MKVRMSALAICFGSVLVCAGCSASQSGSAEVKAASAPEPVAAAQPPVNTPSEFFAASGPIVVEHQIDVSTQREGIIAHVRVDTGAMVSKGQLLAELDDRQIKADHDAAVAKMKSVAADVKNWEAEAEVRGTDLRRSEEMMKANLITQQQLEHDRYSVAATKFEVERERENLRQQQAIVRSLEFEQEKTRIVAPFSGVVARRYVREGQRVANGDRIFWVSETAPMRVKFTLPEQYLGKVKKGDKLAIHAQDQLTKLNQAVVREVSPVVDPASGTIEVQAEILGKPSDLHPGMTATVRIPKTQ